MMDRRFFIHVAVQTLLFSLGFAIQMRYSKEHFRDAAIPTVEPVFDAMRTNVTVKEKTTAILPCLVESLGSYEVVWTDSFATLLTHQDRRIIDDERISIERPYEVDWNLLIRDVRYSDQGEYNCQINTEPVKIKTINLIVQVPPEIIDSLSSSDTNVLEGETVTLVCNATGIPPPKVSWHRVLSDDSDKTQSELCPGSDTRKVGSNGEVLVIHNVTRYCGQSYKCLAYNDIEPSAFKIIQVNVEFAPEIDLPNKRISQKLEYDTVLECRVSAYPHGVVVWERNGQQILTSDKYRVRVYYEGKNLIILTLRIFTIDKDDFGEYTCHARNIIGADTDSMILYEHVRPGSIKTLATTSMPTTTSRALQPTSLSMVYPQTPANHRDQHGHRGEAHGSNSYSHPRQRPNNRARPESQHAREHSNYGQPGTVRIMAGKSKGRNYATFLSGCKLHMILIWMLSVFFQSL